MRRTKVPSVEFATTGRYTDPLRRGDFWALLAVQLLFASTAVVGRLAFSTFTPTAILVFRIGGAAAVFAVFGFARRGREPLAPLSRRDLWLLFWCAVLGLVANQGLYLWGLSLSSATDATVIQTGIPVFTTAIAVLVGDELFTWNKGVGIALALVGALTLAGAVAMGVPSMGDLLLIGNSVSFSAYLVVLRRLAPNHAAARLSRWTFVIAAALIAPAPFYLPMTQGAVTGSGVACAVYIVLGPTVLAYFLNAVALERVESSVAASFIYLQPVFGAAMAVVVLGERPGARTAVGAALIFGGILIAKGKLPRLQRVG